MNDLQDIANKKQTDTGPQAGAAEADLPADAGEVVPAYSANDGAACRCGAAAHPDRPGRCAAGHPLVGHGASLSHTHGLYASSSSSEAAFEEAGHALVEQSIVDAGGRSELGVREVADHEYRGVLHVRILKLAHALNTQGEFDRRRRLRARWIELLDRLISSAVAIDKTLGLGRRPRKVPTLQEYLEQRAEQQQPIGENPSTEGER